ncbi:hypothetical protein [Candidatus Finniella inopinata]|uniref:Glycosyltransferase family 2 protein n=1 Tax=Candidatus Finniella inopinata TaxID=1696036 RepID=A0A4Q7DL26_9PROT|nr:hypothetical protein [Candidatus Finniella inopinata]RZI47100.1 hypothetical protein EQU50_00505 [Candidatus Finniella inopinata]
MLKNKPYLSVVATSRNDDHGGNALWRTQHFVSGLAAQALVHEVSIELILVDWNPPADKSDLVDALAWPENNPYFHYRVVQVPAVYHQQFQFADKLPLFQYLAKNVGIRRAQGEYVLATNIDILFSDKLMQFIKGGLQPGHCYRVDRFDIDPNIPDGLPFPKILEYADSHVVRVNGLKGTLSYKQFHASFLEHLGRCLYRSLRIIIGYSLKNFNYYLTLPLSLKLLQKWRIGNFRKNFTSLMFSLRQQLGPKDKILHTGACGDFTLLSKHDWDSIKAYPEWALYSWHIDSVVMYQAHHNGMKMVNLDSSYRIYHIEHGQGSGWTPEGANLLFNRLDKNGIEYLDDDDLEELFFQQILNKKVGKQTVYNQTWGAPDVVFPERGN